MLVKEQELHPQGFCPSNVTEMGYSWTWISEAESEKRQYNVWMFTVIHFNPLCFFMSAKQFFRSSESKNSAVILLLFCSYWEFIHNLMKVSRNWRREEKEHLNSPNYPFSFIPIPVSHEVPCQKEGTGWNSKESLNAVCIFQFLFSHSQIQ